jgi:hypothetical protein
MGGVDGEGDTWWKGVRVDMFLSFLLSSHGPVVMVRWLGTRPGMSSAHDEWECWKPLPVNNKIDVVSFGICVVDPHT